MNLKLRKEKRTTLEYRMFLEIFIEEKGEKIKRKKK